MLPVISALAGLVALSTAAPSLTSSLENRPGQFPVVDGVVGGGSATINQRSPFAAVDLEADEVPSDAALPVRYVENSGVCETDRSLYQASGYVDVTSTQHIFFWFFEARQDSWNKPVTIWINGGPGSSSMIGLFQENGPCRIRNDSSGIDRNPTSWTEASNMLFIDQPVGTGYSYGDTKVGTSAQAAEVFWAVLQALLRDKNFSILKNFDWALATESYGGHYGPVFASRILDGNANAQANGDIPIRFKSLIVGNGLTSPQWQYPEYITYAKNNPYHQLVSDSVIQSATNAYSKSGGCKDQIAACQSSRNSGTCSSAQSYCNNNILQPLVGGYDVYDVRSKRPDPYPPALEPILQNSQFANSIGAETTWKMSNTAVYQNFLNGGDWMLDSGPQLSKVIDAGVRTHILCGDADYILNFYGVESQVKHLQNSVSSQFNAQKLATWTVDGQPAGLFANAGKFSYTRNYGAGHEVPAYKYGSLPSGRAALVMFAQVISGGPIKNT